jgi:hypothetical protein
MTFAERTGFGDIKLDLQLRIEPTPWFDNWNDFLKSSGNPLIPTQEEAIHAALDEEEAQTFLKHLRPLVEGRKGVRRSAIAYLWCRKSSA